MYPTEVSGVAEQIAAENRIRLGDPVPWFSAPLLTGGSFNLHVDAGRWIVLCFLGSAANERMTVDFEALQREADLFDEDRIVLRGVFATPPGDLGRYAAATTKATRNMTNAAHLNSTVPRSRRVW